MTVMRAMKDCNAKQSISAPREKFLLEIFTTNSFTKMVIASQ